VLVGISDDDYADRFGGRSPLECEKVLEILQAIAAGNPRIIGVDLETSSPGFACLKGQLPNAHVVWVQDASWNTETRQFTPLPVLGTLPAPATAALGVLPTDDDGIIRRYYRTLPVGGAERTRTFPWAVVDEACRAHCDKCCRAVEDLHGDELAEPLRLNFSGERYSFRPLSVRLVVEGSTTDAWGTSGPFVNKIVLLGGDYRAARDSYVTPVGEMTGLQILAQAIESDLNGGGIREFNKGVAFVLDLALGFFVLWVHYVLANRITPAVLVSLVAIPLLSLIASFIAFKSWAFWFNFVPVIVSALIHQLYERARANQRLRAARA
jgi:CHASE2 domain-containing sensor protein